MHTMSPGESSPPASLEARLERIERLLTVLERDRTASADMLARLDAIAERLAAFEQFADHLPMLMATATEIFDSTAARIPDVDGRLHEARDLLERLSRPQTLKSLQAALDVLDRAPQLIAAGTDMADEAIRKMAESGVRVDNLIETVRSLVSRFVDLISSPELPALLDSGMLDAKALDTLGRAARALAEVRDHPPAPAGMFGALRALGHPDVQRSLGFLLGVAQSFGQEMNRSPSSQQLPAPETDR